jgi:hypothetical protein
MSGAVIKATAPSTVAANGSSGQPQRPTHVMLSSPPTGTAATAAAIASRMMRSPMSPLRIVNNTRPQVGKIVDVTIPIATRTTTNAVLKKVWKVTNTGNIYSFFACPCRQQ